MVAPFLSCTLMLEVTKSEILWVITILLVYGLRDIFFSTMGRMKHIKALIKEHILVWKQALFLPPQDVGALHRPRVDYPLWEVAVNFN